MQLRVFSFKRRKQISEITERQLRIQAAGDVQFGGAFTDRLTGDAKRVLNVMRVSIRLTRCAKEAAKLAIDITNVGRIEVPVYVVIRRPPVLLPAHRIGQLP